MNNLLTGLITSSDSATLGIFMMVIFVMIFAIIGLYIYTSFALMAIAKKTKTEPAWLAWIPIANFVLISKIAKMHWWPILLMIPAFLFFGTGFILLTLKQQIAGMILIGLYVVVLMPFVIYSTIWYWKLFEAVNRPGWWSLVPVIPAVISILFSLSKSFAMNLLGSIMSIIGSLIFMVLLGISAWSDNPVKKRKK